MPREIKRAHILLLEELSKGAFGVVYKGKPREDPKRPS
jgi:predicted Ser/Thr protein kinase